MIKPQKSVLSTDEIDELREAFKLFDTENNGYIIPKDLRKAMYSIGFETKCPTLYRMVQEIEATYPEKIDFDKFLDAIDSFLGDKGTKNGIRRIFNLFDSDKTGKISFKNIKRVVTELGENITDEEIYEIIDKTDTLGHGEITFEDFYAIMKRKS